MMDVYSNIFHVSCMAHINMTIVIIKNANTMSSARHGKIASSPATKVQYNKYKCSLFIFSFTCTVHTTRKRAKLLAVSRIIAWCYCIIAMHK
jgi:hypothetical protein